MRRKLFVAALLLRQLEEAASFIVGPSRGNTIPQRRHSLAPCFQLYATTQQQQPTSSTHSQSSVTTIEEDLTDVDTRVLQSMLQEESLGVNTENGIRQLLERGTKTKTATSSRDSSHEYESSSNTKYSSTVVKTLSDTRLWRKLSAQADDLLGSLQLWVSNKVENDLRVVTALGLFAWDRVQRDVARALPAQMTQLNKPLLLTNSSSYDELANYRSSSAFTDLAQPADEIRSVTRTILNILSGQTSDVSSSRSLRTAAPSGKFRVSDRQKRAYQQATKMRQQQSDVTRIIPTAFNAAYELRRELQAETSRPGYKTKPMRVALQQGVAQTNNYLRAAQQQRQLVASKKAVARLQMAQRSMQQTQVALLQEVTEERMQLLQRLKQCIDTPESTWLSEQVLTDAAVENDDTLKLDGDGLQQVVAMMIEIRDDMEADIADANGDDEVDTDSEASAFNDMIQDLVAVRHRIAGLQDRAATAVSGTIAETLFSEILGVDRGASAQPILLRLEELQENYDRLQTTRIEVDRQYADLESTLLDLEKTVTDYKLSGDRDAVVSKVGDQEDAWVVENDDTFSSRNIKSQVMVPDYLDVIPEPLYSKQSSPFFAAEVVLDDEHHQQASSSPGFVAEIVTDEDFDAAFGQARVTTTVEAGDEDEEQTSNPLVDLSLRALDVVFYVLEKTITVVIPSTLRIGQTVSDRILEMQKTNNGSAGWERVRNTVDAKGRY
ncbi:hypothetical protein MPSEU_000972700 [Mayamaea pseudoterrestris]|nr:hypothetical protein MPSEU_000972700 [Mayamaea pseudoterrestris]